jgi:hypothetical protein
MYYVIIKLGRFISTYLLSLIDSELFGGPNAEGKYQDRYLNLCLHFGKFRFIPNKNKQTCNQIKVLPVNKNLQVFFLNDQM